MVMLSQWVSARGHLTRTNNCMRLSTESSNGSAMFTGLGVLSGDFNHPDIWWTNNIAGHEESRRFPKYTCYKFLLRVTKETRRVAVM